MGGLYFQIFMTYLRSIYLIVNHAIIKMFKSNLKYIYKIFFRRCLQNKIQTKFSSISSSALCSFLPLNLVTKPVKITENAGISEF